MMECNYRLSLEELINRPTAELRIVGSDGTEDDDNVDDNQPDQDSEDESDEDDDNEDDEDGGKPDSKDAKIAALKEEVDRHYKRRKAAEKERDDLKKQIADLQKNGTDDEQLRKQVGDLNTENEQLRQSIQTLRIQNSFFGNAEYKWKSPEDAFKLLDLRDVEIDGDKVDGLDVAIRKLAAEKAWLLEESEDDGKSNPKPKRRPAGSPPAGGKGSDDKSRQSREASLMAKYPGLRR